MKIPKKIPNWINGSEMEPDLGNWISKHNPHSGEKLCNVASSTKYDVDRAVDSAASVFFDWSEFTPIKRGQILGNLVSLMKDNAQELSDCIAIETGKPPQDALGEVNAAILQGEYWSGEGMRLYGQSLSSGVPQKQSFTIRQPLGVAALIVPANTPLANISWKSFPALICGNSVVLKASEDAPYTSLLFARITKEAGIPDGVFNVIQGNGKDAGTCILEDTRVKIISFTGSTAVGRLIGEVGGCRLARVSLELGGKNPFVVCDDADIDQAVHWASLSAFSNAGQRCASGSRIIVFDSVYDEFAERLVKKANALKLGIGLDCDLGPVVNLRQQKDILKIIKCSSDKDGKILCGGGVPSDPQLSNGYYIEPTIIELKNSNSNINSTEVFGPVATLQRVDDLVGALSLSNASQYGLTAAIHTSNIDRAMWFAKYINSGVCNINLGTYGSEPHMPFGGFGFSGNGTREPGLEALDVYSELKNISYLTRLEFL